MTVWRDPLIKHGVTTGYKFHACRCDDCRRAWRDAMRAYRAIRSKPTTRTEGTTDVHDR